MNIEIHPTLLRDCIVVGKLALCQLLLTNDSQYPWLILVPDRADLTDFDQLSEADTPLAHADIKLVSAVLRKLFKPTKLNVAALGNVVPQLHIHVIARFETDVAWPQPVWGVKPLQPYGQDEAAELVERLRRALAPIVDHE